VFILANDQKFVNIKFHYLETKNRSVSQFEFIQKNEDFEKYQFDPNLKELNTGWKVLTWDEHNHLYDSCTIGRDRKTIDFIKLRDIKLKTCLKTWDLKDDNGNDVVLNSETIDQLYPKVADELLSGFEQITEIKPAELKNLEQAAEAFFQGKKTIDSPPPIVYEFFLSQICRLKLEYVRNMPMPTFVVLLKLAAAWESVTRKWDAELATAGMSKK